MQQTTWGIWGPGRIARAFARDLRLVPGAELGAVASRAAPRARAFAQLYGVDAAYGSYEELLNDPKVDVIYIATPHARHLDDARQAFAAGKHVLCEKPLALSVVEAEKMIASAREHDRFLMEAMWTACHPVVLTLRDRLRSGELGTPRHLHAELGFVVDAPPEDRLLDPALGAGALLDMGIYPLTFAHLMLGEAEELRATATLSDAGIDLDVAITGRYPGGVLATMAASMTSWSSRRASIATDRGRVSLDDFHHPPYATFTPVAPGGSNDGVRSGAPRRIEGDIPVMGTGYGHEILEVGRCMAEGLHESPLVPHSLTLTILGQMDAIREQIGVEYVAASTDLGQGQPDRR